MLSSIIELESEITKKYSEMFSKTGRYDAKSERESNNDWSDDEGKK